MNGFRFAVIADAHFHDIEGDYGVNGPVFDGRRLALRSFAETRLSTRVFNESYRAFNTALEQVRERGIRHVVLLGDYSDDGQRTTLARISDILHENEARHGLRFYALPGNHDIFGVAGRHHSKEFLDAGGRRVVTSSLPGPGEVPGLYCEGYPEGLKPMADFGFFRRGDEIYWETPFGMSDHAGDRTYEAVSPDGRSRYRLMDASYLIEPVPGVWFVMIDANVFAPVDNPPSLMEAFEDSTAAGWNGILTQKPFLLEWIADVNARARRAGKKVLLFSHYPALDPFEDDMGGESALFGATDVARRRPCAEVGERLRAAGGGVHFSGHLHVYRTTATDDGALTNIAVPSLVAFPAAWKAVTLAGGGVDLEDVSLARMEPDTRIMAAYRLEGRVAGELDDNPCLAAETYGEFLAAHMRTLVDYRFVPRDWPAACAGLPGKLSFAEACRAAGLAEPANADFPLHEAVCDWYLLRYGGAMARSSIDPVRLTLYDALPAAETGDAQGDGFLGTFLLMLRHFAAQSRHSPMSIALPAAAALSAAE